MQPHTSVATSGDAAWMLMSAALVLLMTPALALFYGGMTPRRSTLNMMMMSFGSLGVVTIVYILWGWSMSYGSQSLWGIVSNPLENFGLRGEIVDAAGAFVAGRHGYANVIDICFQLTFAVISVAIISGAIAGRVRYATWLTFTVLWVTAVYFPLAHMVWGGGLLSEETHSIAAWMFGVEGEHALVAPIDFAGGTVIHISAGTAALVLSLLVGSRQGFPHQVGRPHNLPMVMLGAALLWFGWFGFNGGSAFAAGGLAGLAWINTTASAAAGLVSWLIVESIRDKAATSLGAASGLVAGLVSITPAAGAVDPLGALVLGGIGGALACWGIGLKYRFGFDDSLDVVGVHLMAGVWGTIGLAPLAGGGWRLLVVQIVVAAFAMAYAGLLTWGIAALLGRTMGWRVDREDEHRGIDTAIHRESAYEISNQGAVRSTLSASMNAKAHALSDPPKSQAAEKSPGTSPRTSSETSLETTPKTISTKQPSGPERK